MHRLDKIHKLLKKIGEVATEIDTLEFKVYECKDHNLSQNLYRSNQKYKRLNQKLKVQMQKYLDESNKK